MPPKIHQLQIRFIPAEDRLLLRMNTTLQEEFSMWLTRRYVQQLWPGLLKILDRQEPVLAQHTPQAQASVRAFQHQAEVAKADFETQFQQQPERTHPLGKEPVLVSRLQVKTSAKGSPVLCLHPEQGQGLELAMNAHLTHSLCKLLSEALKHTDWGLDYVLETSELNTPSAPQHLN